jgi:hypothetical protein
MCNLGITPIDEISSLGYHISLRWLLDTAVHTTKPGRRPALSARTEHSIK